VKHSHGEFGLAAAAGQHVLLTLPNAADGHQQTAQFMADDILEDTIPIATGPAWGHIDGPGLGVKVDEEKVRRYHEDYLARGDFQTYPAREDRRNGDKRNEP
jgi:L-Ala-D/L-Glu epimerase